MSVLTIIILMFCVISAVDYIFGSKLGLGKEFERGFKLLGVMMLSMTGMIVISPLIASFLSPLFDGVYSVFNIDPSIIPSSLFANDMGGAPLSVAVAKDPALGNFNGLVVSAMMGCTVSFTIPVALQMVEPEKHSNLALGLLCGIVTIPIGCFVSGLICGIQIGALLWNLFPLVLLACIISVGLIFFPKASIKVFKVIGVFIKALVIVGLVLGVINSLAGQEVIKGLATLQEGAMVCVNASVVMAGMFPLIYLVSKLVNKPLTKLGEKIGVNATSVTGVLSSLATSVTTFENMKDMDDKGVMLNSAFAVSGAFTFAGHLAFTMAFNGDYLLPVIVGKLTAGVLAVALAFIIFSRKKKETNDENKVAES